MRAVPARAAPVAFLAVSLVGPLAAPVLLLLGSAPAAASGTTAEEPACTTDRTQYIAQASPVLTNLAIPQTWEIAAGQGTTVAVVDSGVNTGNAHLPAGTAVLPGVSFVPGDTGDGRTDTIGHGTAVAGIIAAREVEGSGMIGAAPRTKILPVRVYSADGDDAAEGDVGPTGAAIAQGIRWAAENGADVVNVSLSVPSNNIDVRAIDAAVRFARSRDVVVVAATGNAPDRGGEVSTDARYPASTDGVIGVAATNSQGVVDARSYQGPQVDVAAPGTSVLVAFQANGDCQTEEVPFTSWATPFVSALAAQLRQLYPDASVDEIEYLITSTARRPVTGQRDDADGWGLIQPYQALTATVDKRRPGPDAVEAADEVGGTAEGARPLDVRSDPLAASRREAVWWWIGGAGLASVALLLRPLVRRRDARPSAADPG